MGTIAEGFIGAKPAAAQIDLLAFFDDVTVLIFDNIGTGNFVGSIF